ELTRWIGRRYLCTWGQVLESVIPAGVKKQAGTRQITMYGLSAAAQSERGTPKLPAKQQAVIDVLRQAGSPLPVDQITAAAQCGPSPIETLRKKGLLQPVRTRQDQFAGHLGKVDPEADLTLNADQQRVLERILASIRRTAQGATDGVGSGAAGERDSSQAG